MELKYTSVDLQVAGTEEGTLVSGIDPANLDRTCKPCEDFYQFANGGWIERHPLPPMYPAYSAFKVLDLQNRDALHKILEEAAASNAPTGSNEQKIGDFYASYMDEAAIERAGVLPLNAQFAVIATLADNAALPTILAQLNALGSSGFFHFGSETDLKDSSTTIAGLAQGGLGLPNRDYYFNTDEPSAHIREAYVAHVEKMFTLLGENPSQAAANAATVMEVEIELARASLSPADMRDPEKMYHKMDSSGLAKIAPNFNWGTYFEALGVAPTAINASNPNFLASFSEHLARWTPIQIRTYLSWHLLRNYARALPAAFDEAHFDFYARTLQGTKEQRPRWQRGVEMTDSVLGEALGEVYVAREFSPEAKAQVIGLVQVIQSTLRDEIAKLDWMSEATRGKAVAKLEALTLKIGYPDTWRDYGTLAISRETFVENLLAGARFDLRRDLAKIDKPVDRKEWLMTPSTVNAYYNPTMNEMVFPAGILQPPFFSPDADPAVNFGAIGVVIGHEMIHGFDDSGRKFDLHGNLLDWWDPADAVNFDERKQGVIDQFDALEPLPGVRENGRLVLGEAIADLGGVTIAYKAFQRWQATQPRRIIDGFTPEQRFFLGFASVWASVESDQYTRWQAMVDPHPYNKFRVNATLANVPEFAQAWDCPIGSMSRPPSERCRLW